MLNFLRLLWSFYNDLFRKFKLISFQQKWKKLNGHNTTIPLSIFPIDKVKVGIKCYGYLNIKGFENSSEKLVIGNYVSISDEVTFILSGNHQTKTFTTYPVYSKFITLSPSLDASTKGPIIIEDEVWIGYGVIILSGVRIGKGAILAAGAVVTKDIPSYTIAGGNPAKVIKYRYSENIIEALNELSLVDFDEKVIVENVKEFYRPLNINQIEKLKKLQEK